MNNWKVYIKCHILCMIPVQSTFRIRSSCKQTMPLCPGWVLDSTFSILQSQFSTHVCIYVCRMSGCLPMCSMRAFIPPLTAVNRSTVWKMDRLLLKAFWLHASCQYWIEWSSCVKRSRLALLNILQFQIHFHMRIHELAFSPHNIAAKHESKSPYEIRSMEHKA